MRSGFGLPRFFEKRVLRNSRGQLLGFRAQAFSLLGEAIRKRQNVFEPASLHIAAPLQVRARAQLAFSSPITAVGRCGDGNILLLRPGARQSYLSLCVGNFPVLAQA
jgi:hypothetical protein